MYDQKVRECDDLNKILEVQCSKYKSLKQKYEELKLQGSQTISRTNSSALSAPYLTTPTVQVQKTQSQELRLTKSPQLLKIKNYEPEEKGTIMETTSSEVNKITENKVELQQPMLAKRNPNMKTSEPNKKNKDTTTKKLYISLKQQEITSSENVFTKRKTTKKSKKGSKKFSASNLLKKASSVLKEQQKELFSSKRIGNQEKAEKTAYWNNFFNNR